MTYITEIVEGVCDVCGNDEVGVYEIRGQKDIAVVKFCVLCTMNDILPMLRTHHWRRHGMNTYERELIRHSKWTKYGIWLSPFITAIMGVILFVCLKVLEA